jgi:hypothetical protein
MLEIQRLQAIALANGFKKSRVSQDGTTTWLYKTGDFTGNTDKKMCIDSVTRSATTFRLKGEQVLDSKTFRNGQEMQAWLDLAQSGATVPQR